ncbi:MAG: tyrosine-type recombinase/integrase [Candidatus Gastranaerophilales bacterium]|nr:tyrosine-type recombinase/integrase [Candidatus Gastranaerophilales bacterium]
MIQQKIIKLAKGLNNFTFNDVSVLLENDESSINQALDQLVISNLLKKRDNLYFYVDKCELKRNNLNPKILEDIKLFKKDDEFYQEYSRLSEKHRKKVDKYIQILKASKFLRGNALIEFIELWNKKHPDLKTSYHSVIRARNEYNHYGLKGLTAKYSYRYIKKIKNLSIYNPKFIDKYLSSNIPSLEECYEKLKIEFLKESSKNKLMDFPEPELFMKKLYEKYSKSEIDFYRSRKRQTNNLNINKISFNDAAYKYLEFIRNNLKHSTYRGYLSKVRNYLLPYFKDLPVEKITINLINNLALNLQESGASNSKVNKIVNLTRNIVNEYNKEILKAENLSDKFKYDKKDRYKTIKVLCLNEIQKLLLTAKSFNTEFYTFLFILISTGLTKGELLALSWDQVDFTNKIITVDRYYTNSKICKHKTKYSIRNVNLPDDILNLLENINKKQSQRIKYVFNDPSKLKSENFSICDLNKITTCAGLEKITFNILRDTYGALLIHKGFSIEYVTLQLGLYSVDNTYSKYKHLLAQEQFKLSSLIYGNNE